MQHAFDAVGETGLGESQREDQNALNGRVVERATRGTYT